jgi:hypothetical protein
MKMIGAVLAAAMMQLARWRRGGVAGRSSWAAEAAVDCCALVKDRKYGAFDKMMIVERMRYRFATNIISRIFCL